MGKNVAGSSETTIAHAKRTAPLQGKPKKTKPKATSRHNLTLSRVRGGLGEGVLIETKGDVAYELGHKRVHSQGLFAVTPHHLTSVTVSGKVRVKENGEWHSVRRFDLAVREQDSQLAHTLVRKQHALLTKDLKLNLCSPDVSTPHGSLDWVTYFTTKQNYGCEGRVWVEMRLR